MPRKPFGVGALAGLTTWPYPAGSSPCNQSIQQSLKFVWCSSKISLLDVLFLFLSEQQSSVMMYLYKYMHTFAFSAAVGFQLLLKVSGSRLSHHCDQRTRQADCTPARIPKAVASCWLAGRLSSRMCPRMQRARQKLQGKLN